MGRCKYEKIAYLEPVFTKLKKLPHIKEIKPGIFYFKAQGFLHFHEKEGEIWADIREESVWGPVVPLSEKKTQKALNNFWRVVKKRYQTQI